jgi:hypothetical protein
MSHGFSMNSMANLIHEITGRHYDRCRLKLLEGRKYLFQHGLVGFTPPCTLAEPPPCEDKSAPYRRGPTAQWLTMMMKRRITSERAEYDQSMSLLSAEYLQGDASFKVSSIFALCHSISTLSQFYHVRVPFDHDSLYACTIYSAAQDYG